jgi:peptidyl-prolyl cis-trans isomerase SurA
MLPDMKNVLLIFLFLCFSHTFFGQTLVRYGNKVITRQEFLAAFRKNNLHIKPTDKSYREYLNLYIRYRLKVQAAFDLKLDTLPGQITDLQNFKGQIIDQYTNDEQSLNQMAREAYMRSKSDIRISYIFVAAPKNAKPADTAKAWQTIQETNIALKKGKEFAATAQLFSEDPFVKNNQGDLGFITVFDLPYGMETVAYKTPVGILSPVFRTDGGYIILKKTAQRPAWGRIRIAQILLAFPIQASAEAKSDTKKRADSIYKAIQAGADFGEMARKFSGDNLSYQLGGVLPEFGIGKYESGFENTAFSLKRDGDISEPYASSFGYHIIKRIGRKPIPAKADQKTIAELKEKIKSDPRNAFSKKQMLQTILKKTSFREFIPSGNMLWDYTDSIIQNKRPASNTVLNSQTILFKFPGKDYLVGDWINYRKGLRSAPSITNGKTNTEILDGYWQIVAFEYYKEHLESFNAAFAAQSDEFRDGNLLFEIMQQQIWNKAAADSAGLIKYFESHAQNYWWKPGAEAILFNTNNANAAKKLEREMEGNMNNWRKIVDSLGGQVKADSGHFENKQIPGNIQMESGHFTGTVNNPDRSFQFAYIIRIYTKQSPRTFEEARGLVLNDYQTELENKWIEELKKKYPVTIYEAVFKNLPK